jgi:hypothetical protein
MQRKDAEKKISHYSPRTARAGKAKNAVFVHYSGLAPRLELWNEDAFCEDEALERGVFVIDG